jgi:hypothetical protein
MSFSNNILHHEVSMYRLGSQFAYRTQNNWELLSHPPYSPNLTPRLPLVQALEAHLSWLRGAGTDFFVCTGSFHCSLKVLTPFGTTLAVSGLLLKWNRSEGKTRESWRSVTCFLNWCYWSYMTTKWCKHLRFQENYKNKGTYIMLNFIPCAIQLILLGWLNKGGLIFGVRTLRTWNKVAVSIPT